MSDNLFFKSTPLYKEFLILDLIEKNSNVTQRELSKTVGSSVSMINSYIDDYEKEDYLQRVYITNKNLEYKITKKGIERKKLLNISYLKASHSIYNFAKENILTFLKQVLEKGFKKIFLYGAGEVAEIMLNVVSENDNVPLEIVGVIDDDNNKQGNKIVNILIHDINKIKQIDHDGLLISSYTHNDTIYKKLIKYKYNINKIITFFDLW